MGNLLLYSHNWIKHNWKHNLFSPKSLGSCHFAFEQKYVVFNTIVISAAEKNSNEQDNLGIMVQAGERMDSFML